MTLLRLFSALLPTILIELAVLLFLHERRAKVLWASVVMNILTNIPLNLFVAFVSNTLLTVLVAEAVVVVVEAIGYRLVVKSWRRAFVYSFLCNAVSFLTGLLVSLVFLLLT